MKSLKIVEFGDPILRGKARRLKAAEVTSETVQTLIENIRHTLVSKKLGVGLAAPQVGEDIALSVIAIRPTKHRPHVEAFDLVIINPKITKTFGYRKQLWEGCISSGAGQAGLFAKVPRYRAIEVEYLDEQGTKQTGKFSGLKAQIIQHETDHLNGRLFVDVVKDTSTYMTMKEYRRRVTAKT